MFISPLTFKEFGTGDTASKEPRRKPFAQKKPEEPETPPPPPTFSEEQLNAAKRDAYQQGFLDGTKEGYNQAQSEQADTHRLLMEGLDNFTKNIAPIFAQYKGHCAKIRHDMPILALSIANKVAGAALSKEHISIIEAAAQKTLEMIISEPEVTVTVNSRLADTLSEKIKQIAGQGKYAQNIKVTADDNMPVSNYRIEWKNGSLERNTEKLWQQMEKAIENMLATLANEEEEQLDLLRTQYENKKE